MEELIGIKKLIKYELHLHINLYINIVLFQ